MAVVATRPATGLHLDTESTTETGSSSTTAATAAASAAISSGDNIHT
jgi:hypothetical protein